MKIAMQLLIAGMLVTLGTAPVAWSQETKPSETSVARPVVLLYKTSIQVVELDLIAAKECGLDIASTSQATSIHLSPKAKERLPKILHGFEEAGIATTLFEGVALGASQYESGGEGSGDDTRSNLKVTPKVSGEQAETDFRLELIKFQKRGRRTRNFEFSFESKLGQTLVMKYGPTSTLGTLDKETWVIMCVDYYDKAYSKE